MTNERPSSCPKCGGERVAQIVWGLVDSSPELVAELQAGLSVLGGCVVSDDDPTWECLDCKHQWG
jgi:hypothetical protein